MNKQIAEMMEWPRYLARNIRVKLFGHHKYEGAPEEVCRKIIDDCYDQKNRYFKTSDGHFCQFWSRDFGMCCESLIRLGYKGKVRDTLVYAMERFVKEKRITTHITPYGAPIDFPNYTPESAAYMLHSLILLNDKKLLSRYKHFFESQAKRIYDNDIDKETGLIRPDINYSTMKDHAIRESCCYLNCMLGMFANDLKGIGIRSELHNYNYNKIIVKYFWRKDHFVDDLSGKDVISGDANTFPFWTGLVKDKRKFSLASKSMRRKGLDRPWPLKYTDAADNPEEMHFYELLVPGYETDTLWIHLGLCWMKVTNHYDKKLLRQYIEEYTDNIKKHKTFLEVYFPDGKPFKRLIYEADEALLWCSIYLELLLETRKL